MLGSREFDFDQCCAKRFEVAIRLRVDRVDLSAKPSGGKLFDDADAQTREVAAQMRRRRLERPIDRGGVHRIVAAHGIVGERSVFDRSCKRSDLVEARRERNQAVPRDLAIGWFEADQITERGRLANRTAGIAADRWSLHTTNGCRRSAARTPGTRPGSYGLRVTPSAEFSHELPIANSSRFVLPIGMQPASRRRATAVAVYGATQCSRILLPAVVRVPVKHMLSLTASGTPASGRCSPAATRASTRAACSAPARAARSDRSRSVNRPYPRGPAWHRPPHVRKGCAHSRRAQSARRFVRSEDWTRCSFIRR